jgi:Glycosyl transferase 4-like domain
MDELATNCRSIVMVARHFPPEVSGGARRPALLADALRRRGHTVAVAAPEAMDGVHWIVPHVAIARGSVPESAPPSFSVRDALRTHLLYPDPDIRWSRRAVSAILASPPDRVDWVITTSPPESVHAAGRRLTRRLGCRWMLDMRDSWLELPLRRELRASMLRRAVERRVAQGWLSRADLVTTATRAIQSEAVALGAANAQLLEQFARPVEQRSRSQRSLVRLVHTGSFSLSDPDRSIEQLLIPFEFAQHHAGNLRLQLIGRLTAAEQERVLRSPVADSIQVDGVVEYRQALAAQQAADILVLVVAPGQTAIPGKLSEYRQVGLPIIAIGDGPWRDEAGIPRHCVDAAMILASRREWQFILPPALDPESAAEQVERWMCTIESDKPLHPTP